VTFSPHPPPFLRHSSSRGFLLTVLGLVLTPGLYNRSPSLRRSWLVNRLQRPRRRRASRGQVAREPHSPRKFLLLDFGAGLFRNLVRDRGFWLRFSSGSRFRMAFLAAGLAGPRGADEPLAARSSSSTKRRTVRTKWGTEMSTPRSLKICAIRWTERPLRCASRISSLYSLKASIFGCFR
jgi:hypothetical protein